MSKFRLVFVLGAMILLFTGCVGGSSPEENIYKVLEDTVHKEKEYVKVQKPLQELEEKDKENYNEIMNLGMKEFDEIVKRSNEAIDNIDKRTELINKERESMNSAKKEFLKIEEYRTKLKNKDLQKEIGKMQETMKERYQTHEKLTSSYLEALSLDKELYTLFKKKDLTMDELEKKITSINEQYNKVVKFNKDYNSKTEEFNKLKKAFYTDSGLEVEEAKKQE